MKHLFRILYALVLLVVATFYSCQDEATVSKESSPANVFVSQAEAIGIAKQFLTTNSDVAPVATRAGQSLPELKMVYTDGVPSTRSASGKRSTYYIINYGDSGYVVVSASKVTYPVLGYSTEGKFDPANIPDNMKGMLNEYADEIRYADDNVKLDDRVKKMRATAIAGTNTAMKAQSAVSPLLGNIKWNQSPYYNAYCPQGTPVGCVATATSQIMRYWQYPSRGTGTHTYRSSYGTHTFNYNYTLNWNNMPAATLRSANQDIANLCYGVAVGLNMDFSPSGSATYQQNVPAMLKEHYFYPNTVRNLERNDYTAAQWNNIVRNELDNRRPVQYAGSGSGGGHSFVCDGYSSNGYFHINWGWGGYSDGYFLLNALDPSGLGIGGGSGGYNYYQTIVVGFAPPEGSGGGDDDDDDDVQPEPEPEPTPTDGYPRSYADNYNSTYIYYVSIGDMVNYSNASGYSDFTNKSTRLEAGQSYYITLMPKFPNGTYPAYWCVWVDFNGDKTFDNSERVLAQYTNSANYFYKTFRVPANAVAGKTRVRVSMKWGGYPGPAEHFTYGEVEDYTAIITKPAPKPDPEPEPEPEPEPDPDPTPEPDPEPEPEPQPVSYCDAYGGTSCNGYINKISLSTMTKVSGRDGYSDFTSYKAYCSRGQSFRYILYPKFSSYTTRMYWRVYVDMNNDGVFSRDEKKVERYSNYSFSGYIFVPTTVKKGKYRIRIVASTDGYKDPCDRFRNGEIEDYTLEVM